MSWSGRDDRSNLPPSIFQDEPEDVLDCDCPDPRLCERLQRHINGRSWEIWNGINIDPVQRDKYRRKWEKSAALLTKLKRRAPLKPCNCRQVPGQPPPPEIRHVWFDPAGIGDTVLCSLVIAGLFDKYPDSRIVWSVPEKNIPWAKLLDTGAAEVRSITGPKLFAHYTYRPYLSYPHEIEEMGTRTRVRYYASQVDHVEPKLPRVLVPWQPNGLVLLFPFAEWANRNMGRALWLELEKKLLAAGHRVGIMDTKAARCEEFQSPKFIGLPPYDVMTMVRGSKCVIAQDSGGAHLGAVCGVRTVVLTGPSSAEKIFNPYPDVVGVPGRLPCTGCYWQGRHYVAACHQSCASLQTILPEDILAQVPR